MDARGVLPGLAKCGVVVRATEKAAAELPHCKSILWSVGRSMLRHYK